MSSKRINDAYDRIEAEETTRASLLKATGPDGDLIRGFAAQMRADRAAYDALAGAVVDEIETWEQVNPALATYEELQKMDRADPVVALRLSMFETRRNPTPVCPKCGGRMRVTAKRKDDGSRFWNCELYPHCDGKIEIDVF